MSRLQILSNIFTNSTNAEIHSVLQMSFAGNTLDNYFIAGFIILGWYILGLLAKWLLCGKLADIAAKTETKADDFIIATIKRPIVLIFLNTGIYLAMKYLVFSPGIEAGIFVTLHSFFVIMFAWFAMKLVDFIIEVYMVPYTQKEDSSIDDHLPPILKNIAMILIVTISGVILLSIFGFDVKTLWAGLGIGGIAIAFAAQDLLANLFGGLSIMFDKPFKVGQRVRVTGIDGEVTQVRIRTTRIKTLDGTMVVIPNRKFSENPIENVTKSPARKVTLNLGIAYKTKNSKVENALEIIKKIILDHPKSKKECFVNFDDFLDSSLRITAVYWIPVENVENNYELFVQAKSEINLKIKEEFEKAGIEFAYPTQTIYMKKDE